MIPALLLALAAPPADVFAAPNRVAWCVVPFDSQKRSPEDRAAMLAGLGFTKFAYDWRAEHLPTFDAECLALKKRSIELTAVWFPAALNGDAEKLLAVIDKHKLTPQLWVMPPNPTGTTDAEKAASIAKALEPVATAAKKRGCKLGVYNHGGWQGEPENMVAVAEKLGPDRAGIVYNLHHGHDHLARLPKALAAMKPHLICLNLNGMTPGGDRVGKKIQILGRGADDAAVLKTVRDSGYTGLIGIIGHTQDDAGLRLADNLDGLNWLLKGGPEPAWRTK